MSGARERTESRNRQRTVNSTEVSTPGTQFGTNILQGITDSGLIGSLTSQADTPFTGDRVAERPTQDQYVAGWGTAPTTFVAPRTTTDAPLTTNQDYVDVNFEPGITEGLDSAYRQSDRLAELSDQGLTRWHQIMGGESNPYLQQMLDRLSTERDEALGQSTQRMADVYGQNGAFGGTSFARDNAWSNEQIAGEYAGAEANLLWEDYFNNNQMLLSAPQGIAGMAGVGSLTADRLLNYGGLGLQNQQHAADVAETNRQRELDNQWLTGSLTDTNAQLAADEAVQQWNAQHQIDEANVANTTAGNEVTQANNQAQLDNEYYRWLSQGEGMQTVLDQLQQLIQMGAQVPGGRTDSAGQTWGWTTGESRQDESAAGIITGIIGAIMGGMGGGMFSGGGG